MKPAAENNLPFAPAAGIGLIMALTGRSIIDAVLPFTEQRCNACFMYRFALYRPVFQPYINSLYWRNTDSCTGAVPIPVLAQYRFLYRRSTDSCTGAVPIPVLAQYRSMTKAGIDP
jgi:hypothetical protein